ncbi:hypothetical protein BS78_01G511800 [Paspalum vaginatum]|nr:hypothetical protein BS78_01G511800 [Paspalum vaginatum]
MGLVSQAVYHGGRHVIGVIPKTVMTSKRLGELRPVEDMHERKAEMARQSDAFLALPGQAEPGNLQAIWPKNLKTVPHPSQKQGGYGTLEELLEAITWTQLGIHHKPIGLLNVDGYYNSMLTFIDHAVEEGFISPSARGIIISAPTAQQLMDQLEEYVPYYDRAAAVLQWETTTPIVYDEGTSDDSARS